MQKKRTGCRLNVTTRPSLPSQSLPEPPGFPGLVGLIELQSSLPLIVRIELVPGIDLTPEIVPLHVTVIPYGVIVESTKSQKILLLH